MRIKCRNSARRLIDGFDFNAKCLIQNSVRISFVNEKRYKLKNRSLYS